jgi:hypothetical protein
MDGLTSVGKQYQSQPTLDLERYFWLPANTGPDVSDEEWQSEMDRMFAASLLVRQFVTGAISPDDFADGLASVGHDPNELFDMWEEGVSLGY